MTKISLLTIFLCGSIPALWSQKPPETLTEFEKKYQRNIRQEYLYGVYIPKDLADAFVQLNRKIDEESRAKFTALPDTIAADKLFFSLGRWIIYNWNFYEGSRFSHYLHNLGIHHPDDMARFVIITYHRNLRRQPLQVKELIEHFQKLREAERLRRLQKGTVLYKEVHKRPKPDSLHNEN
ncbi:MAG: hypothetical protein D6714_05040 [Bacteroidetes bacterium]|nr:MAG: hypothetical protein D6714_05040 [Bacteroidota bacterium]